MSIKQVKARLAPPTLRLPFLIRRLREILNQAELKLSTSETTSISLTRTFNLSCVVYLALIGQSQSIYFATSHAIPPRKKKVSSFPKVISLRDEFKLIATILALFHHDSLTPATARI